MKKTIEYDREILKKSEERFENDDSGSGLVKKRSLCLMQTKALFIANRGSVHVDQSLCFIRTVTVQRKLSDVRADFFQIACIRFIKAVRCITVYIQHSDDVSFFYNRYYYL